MNVPVGGPIFSGSVPQLYQRYMVPMLFEPYALDLAARAAALHPASVLEVAAGTGVVTRKLANQLPAEVSIVATDINPAMLAQATSIGTSRQVSFLQADAMALPFDDQSVDLVVCQFGYMFLPDKVAAFAEARRVLRLGGTFLLSLWDRIEDNDFAADVAQTLAALFPDDPPQFMSRIPHGYHDRPAIMRDLANAGFTGPVTFETVVLQSRADTPRDVALAFCQGTPMRNELESRNADMLDPATDAVAAALQERYGEGPVTAKMQAHVIAAARGAQ